MKKATLSKKMQALTLSAVMAATMLAGGATAVAAADEEPVELLWYVAGPGPQADTGMVLEEVNKYLLEKLNCTLKIVETDFGNYTQKMQMVTSSQEEFDICWTAHWSNNFYSNVSRNAFLELDELVEEYAPDLLAAMPENGWEACKVNGHLYGVPSQQIWAMTNAVTVRKDLIEKYNFDIDSVKSLKDMEPLCEAFKADNPDYYPFLTKSSGTLATNTFNMGYDELAGRHIPGVIMLDDEELKVINQFELPQVKEFYETMYDWCQKGYIRPDAATLNDTLMDQKAGKYAFAMEGNVKPGIEVIQKVNFGDRDVVCHPISESWQPTSGITATMNAISRTSKHPEKAMEFLNLLNTDEYLFNLIANGLEGVHYEKLEGNYIRPIEGSGYYPNSDWVYGNQFLGYLKEGQGENDWADTLKMNQDAKPSPALGFVFDPVPVQNEIATVSAVVKEYETSLSTGAINPEEALPEFLEKLNQAGAETIIAEVQTQLDAWAAAK